MKNQLQTNTRQALIWILEILLSLADRLRRKIPKPGRSRCSRVKISYVFYFAIYP